VLTQIDANLLVALDVLLEERHVTRAAARLGVTQSAMSQTLQRLRTSLDDPLLIRSGKAMVMTPRAEAMVGPLRTALRALEQALVGPTPFDPGAARRSFTVAMLDVYAFNLLPRVLERVAAASPHATIDVLALQLDAVWDQLRDGRLELAIVGPRPIPEDMGSVTLFRERLVSICRRGHPLLSKRISAKAFVRWPHAVFRITGRGTHSIDEQLAARGLERRIATRLPYFLAAPALVSSSDQIVTLPVSLATEFAKRWPIELFDPPLAPMGYDVRMVWPRFLAADGAQRWLRDQVIAASEGLGEGATRSP
jgi:DNA-binding transcriptional LysR family regulator